MGYCGGDGTLGAVGGRRGGVIARPRPGVRAVAGRGLPSIIRKAATQPVTRSLALRQRIQLPSGDNIFSRVPVVRARPEVTTFFAPPPPQLPNQTMRAPVASGRAEPGPAEGTTSRADKFAQMAAARAREDERRAWEAAERRRTQALDAEAERAQREADAEAARRIRAGDREEAARLADEERRIAVGEAERGRVPAAGGGSAGSPWIVAARARADGGAPAEGLDLGKILPIAAGAALLFLGAG